VPVVASDGGTGCGGANFAFCAYHDEFESGGNPYRYAVLPFPCNSGGFTCFVGPSDDVSSAFAVSGSHELTELVTDPDNSMPGWYSERTGQENADICAADACNFDVTVGADTFVTNSTWSNLARGCVGTVACPVRPIGCTDTAPGACSAGSGKTGACSLEWQVDPNLTQKKGITTGRVTCVDGLPFCDADTTPDGTCTFHVAACMNNSDPRYATCSVSPIEAVTIRKPVAGDPLIPTLLGALEGADPAAVGALSGSTLTFSTPAASADSCTGYLNIPVPAGTRSTIMARVTTAAGHASSKLMLGCVN
jgi:hypothetical protein